MTLGEVEGEAVGGRVAGGEEVGGGSREEGVEGCSECEEWQSGGCEVV